MPALGTGLSNCLKFLTAIVVPQLREIPGEFLNPFKGSLLAVQASPFAEQNVGLVLLDMADLLHHPHLEKITGIAKGDPDLVNAALGPTPDDLSSDRKIRLHPGNPQGDGGAYRQRTPRAERKPPLTDILESLPVAIGTPGIGLIFNWNIRWMANITAHEQVPDYAVQASFPPLLPNSLAASLAEYLSGRVQLSPGDTQRGLNRLGG